MIVKIKESNNPNAPQFVFDEGTLDVVFYSIVPEKGIYIHLARVLTEDSNPDTSLEVLAQNTIQKTCDFEFYSANGRLIKKIQVGVRRYIIDDSDANGVIYERLFATER